MLFWNIDRLAHFTADMLDSTVNSKIYQGTIDKKPRR